MEFKSSQSFKYQFRYDHIPRNSSKQKQKQCFYTLMAPINFLMIVHPKIIAPLHMRKEGKLNNLALLCCSLSIWQVATYKCNFFTSTFQRPLSLSLEINLYPSIRFTTFFNMSPIAMPRSTKSLQENSN